ncbi:MAG: ATPase, partial [Peptococcaceae bacterium]|nr:ATPase [Peptococcaceae bacterium]
MEEVFALDIGTRVVIGLIMKKNEQGFEIIASAREEHKQRAMYDGQVHDVDEVARAVLKVKQQLEVKTGKELKKVAVAAAGRAIRTQTASAKREEVFPIVWEKPDVIALEMEAVQNALRQIGVGPEKSYLHCVGYSTIQQQLEDLTITSLIGQTGKKAEITVIATFLPRTVVNGLIAVLQRVGLEMDTLTLEPIAAGQAAIPPDMRRLNLALVDIGAGTADIALTKEGSFFAYGMVPMAGDEVTEALCSHYLLEFQEGEKIKKSLSAENTENIEIINFFGDKYLVTKNEVLAVIKPVVKMLAERVCQEIILLNGTKPQAIILVGGGSLTPLLREAIAEVMEIPNGRVGIQIRERLKSMLGEEESLYGADVVTPIGIGMTAINNQGLHYYSVNVNGLNVPIFDLQPATVADTLLAAGIQPRSIVARPGAALVYELNGEMKILKGELGKPAEIYVNGQPANLDQFTKAGDVITFVPGKAGDDAKAKIKDVYSFSYKKISFNGEEEIIYPTFLLDGKVAREDEWLKDGSKLVVKEINTLFDLLKVKGYSPTKLKKRVIKINGHEQEISPVLEVKINGQTVSQDCILKNNDIIEVKEREIRIKDLDISAEPMRFLVNGREFYLPPYDNKIFAHGKELSPDDLVEDNMELRVEGFTRKPILSEIFPYLNLETKAIHGGRLQMSVNGKSAEFTTELNPGDSIF